MKASIRIIRHNELHLMPPTSILSQEELIRYVEKYLLDAYDLNRKGFRFALLEAKLAYVPVIEVLKDFEEVSYQDLSLISVLPYSNSRYIKELKRELKKSKPYINPLQIPFSVSNAVTGWIALKLGTRGANLTLNGENCLSSIVSAIKFIADQISFGYFSRVLLLAGDFGGLVSSNFSDPIKTYAFLLEFSDSRGITIEAEDKYIDWNIFIDRIPEYSSSSVIIESAVKLPSELNDVTFIENSSACSFLCSLLASPISFLDSIGVVATDITYVIVESLDKVNVLRLKV